MRFPLLSIRFWLLISILIGATIQSVRSQTHIDTLKNNAVSFEFGLPITTSNISPRIEINRRHRRYGLSFQTVFLRANSFLFTGKIAIKTEGDACETFCPQLDISVYAAYGMKRHFVSVGIGSSAAFYKPLSAYYSIAYHYFISPKIFASFSMDQVLWYHSMEFWLPATDQCEECTERRYNIWTWDLGYSDFILNFGVGIKF